MLREMSWFAAKVALVTVLVVLGIQWSGLRFSLPGEREANERVIVALEVERDKLRLELKTAREEMQLLMRTGYAEASRLVTSWSEICSRLTLRNLIGDIGCGEALKKGFPDRKFKLMIHTNPEAAIRVAQEFIIDRCRLVESQPLKICLEFGDRQPISK